MLERPSDGAAGGPVPFSVLDYVDVTSHWLPRFWDRLRPGSLQVGVQASLRPCLSRGWEQFAIIVFSGSTAQPRNSSHASWYGDECRGLPMANGCPFNPDALTCASWYYPLGTLLEIQHESRSVAVIVTDRGPRADLARGGIEVDLSRRAFELLGDLDLGHLAVTIQVSI